VFLISFLIPFIHSLLFSLGDCFPEWTGRARSGFPFIYLVLGSSRATPALGPSARHLSWGGEPGAWPGWGGTEAGLLRGARRADTSQVSSSELSLPLLRPQLPDLDAPGLSASLVLSSPAQHQLASPKTDTWRGSA
jgi:hypothetical protein